MNLDASNDRRRRSRLHLTCSLRVRGHGLSGGFAACTEDISCAGFYFISDEMFTPGVRLDCDLEVGNGAVGSSPKVAVQLRMNAEVVRVDLMHRENKFGIACRIQSYTIDQQKADLGIIPQDVFVGALE